MRVVVRVRCADRSQCAPAVFIQPHHTYSSFFLHLCGSYVIHFVSPHDIKYSYKYGIHCMLRVACVCARVCSPTGRFLLSHLHVAHIRVVPPPPPPPPRIGGGDKPGRVNRSGQQRSNVRCLRVCFSVLLGKKMNY